MKWSDASLGIALRSLWKILLGSLSTVQLLSPPPSPPSSQPTYWISFQWRGMELSISRKHCRWFKVWECFAIGGVSICGLSKILHEKSVLYSLSPTLSPLLPPCVTPPDAHDSPDIWTGSYLKVLLMLYPPTLSPPKSYYPFEAHFSYTFHVQHFSRQVFSTLCCKALCSHVYYKVKHDSCPPAALRFSKEIGPWTSATMIWGKM